MEAAPSSPDRSAPREVATAPIPTPYGEFLAEMNAAVGLSARNLLTVGETPGATVEVARRITDPALRTSALPVSDRA